MAEKIKILIADDHTLVRQSIAMALEYDRAFVVIGQAENGKIVLDLVKKNVPDVILLDLDMPVMNGWETMDLLKKNYPKIKVVIVSMHFEGLLIKDLVNRGACGFLPKNSDFETLINAIHDVNEVGYFFSKKISTAIVKELVMSNSIQPTFSNVKLTEKELEILLMICHDKLMKEIADELGLSERSVERHKAELYKKTNSKTYAGLALFAVKNNLLTV